MARSRWLIEMNQWPNTTATIDRGTQEVDETIAGGGRGPRQLVQP
jgi:hypothetical protein